MLHVWFSKCWENKNLGQHSSIFLWRNQSVKCGIAASQGSKYFWLEHFYIIPSLNTAQSLRLYAKQWMAFIISLLTKINKAKATNYPNKHFLFIQEKKEQEKNKTKKHTKQQQQMLCFSVLQKFWLHPGHFTEFLSQGAWTLHFGPADRHQCSSCNKTFNT